MSSKRNNSSQAEKLRRYHSPGLRGRAALSLAAPLFGTQELIHDRIWDALLDGELRPGAKVPELQIGKAFKVSRTIVRNVLIIMEQEGVITLPPNRGAFIAGLSPDKTRYLFEATRLMSCYVVEDLARKAKTISTEDRARIKQHLQFMGEKTTPRNYRTMMRLGAEFLILLSSIHENKFLAAMQERSMTLIMMAALLYQHQVIEWPLLSAQTEIIKQIYAGNAAKASAEVNRYLAELEDSFHYRSEEPDKDVFSIISDLSDGLELPELARRRTARKKRETPQKEKGSLVS